MERLRTIVYWLSVCAVIAFFLTMTSSGCVVSPQPELHPIAGTSVMFIPEGCKIGKITAPENGIYIGESKLLESMRQQQEEEEKRKEQSRT